MDKALIEKAFEKWIESKKDKILLNTYDYEVNTCCEAVPYTYIKDEFFDAVCFGATWQREQLEAEIKELKERCERYIWNLGGVSTLLLGYSIDEFNKEYALPALIDTNEFVKKYQHLQAENKTIKEQSEIQTTSIRNSLIKELREYCSKGFECGYGEVISCQDLTAKLDLLEGEI